MFPVRDALNRGLSNSETAEILSSPLSTLLTWLLDSLIVLPEEWDELPAVDRQEILFISSRDRLLEKLIQLHLLTQFQADCIEEGMGDELVLNHYRLLDILGRGGMGTVYRAEHILLRRQVAVKVMSRALSKNARLLHRFYAEARAVAKLHHPNIVICLDAGRTNRSTPSGANQDYFAMELIPGQDLFGLVNEKGPLSPWRTCDLFRQVADALAEAHRLGLIHRDIKPGNIQVTPDWQAKVLDFGLARLPNGNLTEFGSLLGTIGYMAPEQAHDPTGVDARADLFSLGATMYWALTGREPYPESGNPIRDLHHRLTTSPAPVRQVRPEISVEVSELVSRLMQTNPDDRYPSARAVAAALSGFSLWLSVPEVGREMRGHSNQERVLVVEDDPPVRDMMTMLLADEYDVSQAQDANSALEEVSSNPPDLMVVDVNLADTSGPDLIEKIRKIFPQSDQLKVLLISGAVPSEALGALAVVGADDFLSKPFSPSEFQSRVRSLILRRSRGIEREQATLNGTVRIPAAAAVRPTRPAPVRSPTEADILSFTISQFLVNYGLFSEGHWLRIRHYVRELASVVSGDGEYRRLKDKEYFDKIISLASIYDVGFLGISHHVLMKPDQLNRDEMIAIQKHTTQGAQLLTTVANQFAAEVPSLPVAAEIIRSHHEHWDGSGYPDKLAGRAIPLSARVVAIVSVYEALRSPRPHRPALTHTLAKKMIMSELANQFDPLLLTAFVTAAPQFELISKDS